MKLIGIVGSLVLLLAAPFAAAEDYAFEEGTHYTALQIPLKTRHPNKIAVEEYFSYGCPHCYQFEPLIGAWKADLADDVVFTRTPAVWNRDYLVYAQTYLSLVSLGILDQVHVPIFNAIHNERRRLNSAEAMAKFLTGFGVDPEDFAKTYNSFGIRAAVQQADSRGRGYRSTGVPALVVNGKYLIEGSTAGSNANMLRVANFLIEKERQLISQSAE